MRRCDGVNRREFLRAGSLAAFNLGLTDALRSRAGAHTASPLRNCILIWLDGGPSHLDMFDLKPDAPSEVRGNFNPVVTNVPGLQICEEFQRLATMMDRVCLIRSMTSELGEHNFGRHYLLTGYKPTAVLQYPSYGSVMAQVRPEQDSRSALPPYIAVPNFSEEAANGYLPGATRPFAVTGDPSKPDFRVRDLDMTGAITAERLGRRRQFLGDFDRISARIEQNAVQQSRDAQFEQAYRLIFSADAKRAFDLTLEPASTRQLYGPHRIGQSCLLARRLIEAGCPFVTVTDNGWDTHGQIYRELREGYVGGHAGRIPLLDQALAALLDDLSRRALIDETLVLVMGEFGRTPKLNTAGGRDHWPRVFSVLLAGAGIKGGQAIGRSDSRGESPADRPVTPSDLARTVYTALGVDPNLELHTGDGRPVRIAAAGAVVSECFA